MSLHAELLELGACLLVIRLRVRAGRLLPVVVLPGLDVCAGDLAHHGVGAFAHRRARLHPGCLHHARIHHRRRVQRGDGDLAIFQLRGKVHREQHLRELALAVSLAAAAGPLEHHVGEVDGRLRDRRDVDDARRRTGDDRGQQRAREQEAGQVVHREVHLVAVLADLTVLEQDARVVDQDVDALVVAEDRLRQRPHLGERGEVGFIEPRASLAVLRDLGDDGLAALFVPAVDDDLRAEGGHAARDLAPQPVRGAGDHHDLAL